MKRLVFIVGLLVIVLATAFSQIKIACVGNSITYGYGIKNREVNSYPAQLGKILGSEWEVENFGNSGSTLLKNGDKPYWKQKEFEAAKAFLPDVVIIKLGTNDTKPQNWKYKDEYVPDFTTMINEFRALPSKPLIVVCIPVPAYSLKWGINDSIIRADVTPMVKKVAKMNHTLLINLYVPLSNHPGWFSDTIHPNAEGAGVMANVIAKDLLKWKKKIVKRKK